MLKSKYIYIVLVLILLISIIYFFTRNENSPNTEQNPSSNSSVNSAEDAALYMTGQI